MQATSRKRYDELVSHLSGFGSALVAFSGGVDSSLLVCAGKDALGPRVVAATSRSKTHPEHELKQASLIAELLGVEHVLVDTSEMQSSSFTANAPDRCYHCKREMFSVLAGLARSRGLAHVLEGSNLDDLGDRRPGRKAVAELLVRSPYMDLAMGKQEIREMAKDAGLPNWDRPAMACLATRIPCGEPITAKRLARVGRAEQALFSMGYRGFRVRDHGDVARIEIQDPDFVRLVDRDERERITMAVREAGFRYVSLDLAGYRTGSMNELLDE